MDCSTTIKSVVYIYIYIQYIYGSAFCGSTPPIVVQVLVVRSGIWTPTDGKGHVLRQFWSNPDGFEIEALTISSVIIDVVDFYTIYGCMLHVLVPWYFIVFKFYWLFSMAIICAFTNLTRPNVISIYLQLGNITLSTKEPTNVSSTARTSACVLQSRTSTISLSRN